MEGKFLLLDYDIFFKKYQRYMYCFISRGLVLLEDYIYICQHKHTTGHSLKLYMDNYLVYSGIAVMETIYVMVFRVLWWKKSRRLLYLIFSHRKKNYYAKIITLIWTVSCQTLLNFACVSNIYRSKVLQSIICTPFGIELEIISEIGLALISARWRSLEETCK